MILASLGVAVAVAFAVTFQPPFLLSDYYNGALLGANGLFLIDIIFNMRAATYDSQTG